LHQKGQDKETNQMYLATNAMAEKFRPFAIKNSAVEMAWPKSKMAQTQC